MVIFHSYVSLPEGTSIYWFHLDRNWDPRKFEAFVSSCSRKQFRWFHSHVISPVSLRDLFWFIHSFGYVDFPIEQCSKLWLVNDYRGLYDPIYWESYCSIFDCHTSWSKWFVGANTYGCCCSIFLALLVRRCYNREHWISGWCFGTFGLCFHILGISSSQVTFTHIFQRGWSQPPSSYSSSHDVQDLVEMERAWCLGLVNRKLIFCDICQMRPWCWYIESYKLGDFGQGQMLEHIPAPWSIWDTNKIKEVLYLNPSLS